MNFVKIITSGPELRNAQCSPQLEVYLAGKHAEEFFQMTTEEYVNDTSKRKLLHDKFEDLLYKPVTISVSRAREDNKNYGYQIVNSYFDPQPETE